MKVYKPKADFESSIGIQKQYVDLLKTHHAQLMIKCNNSKGYTLSKHRLELHEISSKLDSEIKLLTEKQEHFDVYVIGYDKELEECKKEWDFIWTDACAYIYTKKERNDICDSMKSIMDAYMELDKENREYIEVKNVVYKNLKTLLPLE
tara:strand:+ start:1602 stop:2048 length:447 start_codon:yes stop_codon:yes gene_type:complete